MQTDLECCVVTCDIPLDKTYWDNQYIAQTTGWDLGEASPPLVEYFNTLDNKNISILIPGCGNAYEVEYLLQKGFSNITVIDISPTVCHSLQEKFNNNPQVKIICGDFFELNNQYDLIVEQTFFCALPPSLRQQYVYKMHQLLKKDGRLAGLLFNRRFEKNPPFGGSKEEYENLFKSSFIFKQLDVCKNSVAPRANTELFFEFEKNNEVVVSYYTFKGITCNGCMNTVTNKFSALPNVLNAGISSDYRHFLIVSTRQIDIQLLRNEIAYDEKYSIEQL